MFKFNSKPIFIWMCFASLAALVSCSTPRKAELESAVPTEAIQEVETKQNMIVSEQLDLFAPKIYRQGVEKLNDAKVSVKKQDDASKTMTLAAQAKAYLEDVESYADKKSRVPNQILDARASALDAVRENEKLRREMVKVDDELRYETDSFSKDLGTEAFANLQQNYLEIQVRGVQNSNLGTSRQVIEKAEGDGARKLVPNTLEAAKRNVLAAENLIAANVNNPPIYESSVAEANRSAKLLHDVVAKSHEMGTGTTERVALELVEKDRKIGKLSSNIADLEGSLSGVKAEAATATSLLTKKDEKLEDVSRKVRLQEAIDRASQEFSDEEAAVYQQGNRLIIRLKKMDFASGSAELPGSSMPLLSKVDNVIKSIGAERILVQGHTDSTGPESINMKLSQKRAESVASYLKSVEKDLNVYGEGLGESKPLASNSSKEGRALNRRVDIVVTVTK